MSIESIGAVYSAVRSIESSEMVGQASSIKNTEFLQLITTKIDQVNGEVVNANEIFSAYIKGDEVEIHDVMIAMGKAKTELKLFVEVRNNILESYKEITRIQL